MNTFDEDSFLRHDVAYYRDYLFEHAQRLFTESEISSIELIYTSIDSSGKSMRAHWKLDMNHFLTINSQH